jgi:tetratricopeptide (TPR) repeat protein
MNRLAAPIALLAAAAAAACAMDDPESLGTQVYVHNAQEYMDGNHYDQALAQWRRALELEPDNRKALLGEASCLYWLGTGGSPVSGEYILEAEEKAERLDADSYGTNGWKVLLTQGLISARLSDLWGLKAELAKKNVAAGLTGAEDALRTAEGNRDRYLATAMARFEAVLATEDEPFAKNNLTSLFFLASRGALRARTPAEYERPLEWFRRYAVEVDKSKKLWAEMKKKEPDLAEVYQAKLQMAEKQELELRDLVANIYFKLRRHEDSIAELDRVIALDPYRAGAFLARGQNQEELGRFGAAADDYRRFLMLTDLAPDSPLVLEASERKTKCEELLREKLSK